MTPVASWTEADYYAASRAARRAFDRTNQQLSIGLDEAEGGLGLVEPAADSPQTPPAAGSQVAAEPCRTLLMGPVHVPGAADAGVKTASSAAYSTTTAPAAEPGWGLRGRCQKGA